MKRLFCFVVLGLICYSCGQKRSANEDESKNHYNESSSSQKKDSVTIKLDSLPVKTDSIPVHIFKSGETLWNLCRTLYGNRHYSAILATYNEIEDVRNIENGTPIKIPVLESMQRDPKLGLDPIHDEMTKILRARELFMKHEKALGDLREEVEGRTPINLPNTVKLDMEKAVTLVDEAIISMGNLDSDSIAVPTKTIGQLRRLKSNLDNLSKGNHDGRYKYDLDMVHQTLVHIIRNSIAWSQNDYR